VKSASSCSCGHEPCENARGRSADGGKADTNRQVEQQGNLGPFILSLFNARLRGHGKSDLVGRVHPHVLPSATKGTLERVSDRVFGNL
jgi:hypothetical protein